MLTPMSIMTETRALPEFAFGVRRISEDLSACRLGLDLVVVLQAAIFRSSVALFLKEFERDFNDPVVFVVGQGLPVEVRRCEDVFIRNVVREHRKTLRGGIPLSHGVVLSPVIDDIVVVVGG